MAFKLRSGNRSSFKMMGSSPAKINILGAIKKNIKDPTTTFMGGERTNIWGQPSKRKGFQRLPGMSVFYDREGRSRIGKVMDIVHAAKTGTKVTHGPGPHDEHIQDKKVDTKQDVVVDDKTKTKNKGGGGSDLSKLKHGSQERIDEYKRSGWAMDDTTKLKTTTKVKGGGSAEKGGVQKNIPYDYSQRKYDKTKFDKVKSSTIHESGNQWVSKPFRGKDYKGPETQYTLVPKKSGTKMKASPAKRGIGSYSKKRKY